MKYIILSVYCNGLATPLLGQTTNGSGDTVRLKRCTLECNDRQHTHELLMTITHQIPAIWYFALIKLWAKTIANFNLFIFIDM